MSYINLKCKYQSCYLRANLLHRKRQTVAWLKTREGGLHVCRVPRPLQQFTNLWQLSKKKKNFQGDISTTWHIHIHGLNIMTYTGCPKKIILPETLKNKSKWCFGTSLDHFGRFGAQLSSREIPEGWLFLGHPIHLNTWPSEHPRLSVAMATIPWKLTKLKISKNQFLIWGRGVPSSVWLLTLSWPKNL